MYFGQLLGGKTILNEFIAISTLRSYLKTKLSQKTVIMSTYVSCGFANIASIGIQVGGIGILVLKKESPSKIWGNRAYWWNASMYVNGCTRWNTFLIIEYGASEKNIQP